MHKVANRMIQADSGASDHRRRRCRRPPRYAGRGCWGARGDSSSDGTVDSSTCDMHIKALFVMRCNQVKSLLRRENTHRNPQRAAWWALQAHETRYHKERLPGERYESTSQLVRGLAAGVARRERRDTLHIRRETLRACRRRCPTKSALPSSVQVLVA